jgi:hypothetical protein
MKTMCQAETIRSVEHLQLVLVHYGALQGKLKF